ncbi:MAG: NUDIX domain-containing protein [Aggregatilineales bacterium]
MVELLDIYDDSLTKIGVKARPDVHRDGDWHCVFHCWVIYRDENAQDWVIVQKRAPNKATFPNYLDVSAAGHYEAGETMQDGIREVQEELGLILTFDDLVHVGKRVSFARYGALIDREIADVFFYICDQPLTDYHYQHEELAGLVAVNIDTGLRLFSDEVETISAPAVGLETDEISISRKDFIPTPDEYFYKTLILARRCLNGEKHLLI